MEQVEIFDLGGPSRCGMLLAGLKDAQGRWLSPVSHPPVDGLTGRGTTVAIVDTGLSLEHPQIVERVVERVDLTGAGVGDVCGHGTVVALILLSGAPDASLVEVKALGDDGRSDPATLIRAFEWLASRPDVAMANVSAGVYRPRCTGSCDVCRAAAAAAEAGTIIQVAAGNKPWITACPAKSDAVMAISIVDPASGRLAPGASPATEHGFVQVLEQFELRPYEP